MSGNKAIDSKQQYDAKTAGKGINFERVRRITGYLVGDLDRFNDAKRSEVADRIKHNI